VAFEGMMELAVHPGVYGQLWHSDPVVSKSIECDDVLMKAVAIISTESMDRSRDVVVQKGLDFTDFRSNPVVLLNHDRTMPIGRAVDPEGAVTLELLDGMTKATTYFSKSSLVGEQAYRMVKDGLLAGASITFKPKPGAVAKYKGDDGWPVTVYKAASVLEYSHVTLPDNQDCIAEVISKGIGGKPLDELLRASLLPYLPEKKTAVVGGYDAPANGVAKVVKKDAEVHVNHGYDRIYIEVGMPPGAKLLANVYGMCKDGIAMVDRQRQQLEPNTLQDDADLLMSAISDICDMAGKAFNAKYPDLPSLWVPDAPVESKAAGVRKAWAARVATEREDAMAELDSVGSLRHIRPVLERIGTGNAELSVIDLAHVRTVAKGLAKLDSEKRIAATVVPKAAPVPDVIDDAISKMEQGVRGLVARLEKLGI
jgi:phage head maturation protease